MAPGSICSSVSTQPNNLTKGQRHVLYCGTTLPDAGSEDGSSSTPPKLAGGAAREPLSSPYRLLAGHGSAWSMRLFSESLCAVVHAHACETLERHRDRWPVAMDLQKSAWGQKNTAQQLFLIVGQCSGTVLQMRLAVACAVTGLAESTSRCAEMMRPCCRWTCSPPSMLKKVAAGWIALRWQRVRYGSRRCARCRRSGRSGMRVKDAGCQAVAVQLLRLSYDP